VGLTQAVVTERLAALAKDGSISTKLFKNKPIYWAKQDRYETLDPAQLQELETEIKGLREKDIELKKQCAELRKANELLASEPTDAELVTKLEEMESECAKLSKRLDVVKGNQKAFNPQEKKVLETKYEFVRKEWRSRKRKFSDICDAFEENGALDAKKLKKLKKELGIETDEDVKVSLENDKTSALRQATAAPSKKK